ncbi:MAG: DUF5318 family protein [Acidimicrobiales bacterium]
MSFRPASLGGPTANLPGQIDYRLARNAKISEFRKGRLSRNDVCDAHPELIRAARNIGEATEIDCPICGEVQLVLVRFVFGPRMPAHGHCLGSATELSKLARRSATLACYVIEVCPHCCWNHMTRAFSIGGGGRAV